MPLADVRPSFLPQFFPADWLKDIPDIIHRDFPSRIRIGYVFRENGSYSYLLKEEFAGLHMPLEELHSTALTNLRELPSAQVTIARVPGGPEGYVASDDNFAAVRLLLLEVRTKFAAKLGAEFFAVMPHRDECFCWSGTQSDERQARHAAEALESFVEDEYNLTPDIFLVSEGGFQVHRLQ